MKSLLRPARRPTQEVCMVLVYMLAWWFGIFLHNRCFFFNFKDANA